MKPKRNLRAVVERMQNELTKNNLKKPPTVEDTCQSVFRSLSLRYVLINAQARQNKKFSN